MAKTKIWYVYGTGSCGDGCCSWSDCVVEDSDNSEWEVSIMYDVEDFQIWLAGMFGDNWADTYEIDLDNCSFY